MAAEGGGLDLGTAVTLLGAAVAVVPVFRRLGLGSVLGYLAAGLAVGPYGLAVIADPEAMLHAAEIGVVLFLFIIGLEMEPRRLWQLRRQIFGLGLAQVLLGMAALMWVGVALGFPTVPSLIAGTGFVLTSTAVVMQMLAERGQMATPAGQRIVSILLLEDLAIVPLLAMVAFLAPVHEEVTGAERLRGVALGLGAIAALLLAGRFLINPLFARLARFGGREVMTAGALLVVLGSAMLLDAGGLSMAMGAFLAGVLLSESTFRHQLEADVEPFRGLLLGLFFLSVGMSLDLAVVAEEWWLVLLSVVALVALKMAVIYVLARIAGADHAEASERAALMAQGGEFAFVLYGAAAAAAIIDGRAQAILTAVIILSMALTPLLVALQSRLAPKAAAASGEAPHDLRGDVLLIGFGRVGQIVSQPLLAQGYGLSIIDTDTDMIEVAGAMGFKVWFGDGARLDILHAAGARQAALIAVCTDAPETTARIVALCKAEFPQAIVLARAFDRAQLIRLVRTGADAAVRETHEGALALAREALVRLGADEVAADDAISEARARDRDRLAAQWSGDIASGRDLLVSNLPPEQRDALRARGVGTSVRDRYAATVAPHRS